LGRKELDAFEENEGPILADGKIDDEGTHDDGADLHP
jgi:hypothetical protein